jgi:hypothetical protein
MNYFIGMPLLVVGLVPMVIGEADYGTEVLYQDTTIDIMPDFIMVSMGILVVGELVRDIMVMVVPAEVMVVEGAADIDEKVCRYLWL